MSRSQLSKSHAGDTACEPFDAIDNVEFLLSVPRTAVLPIDLECGVIASLRAIRRIRRPSGPDVTCAPCTPCTPCTPCKPFSLGMFSVVLFRAIKYLALFVSCRSPCLDRPGPTAGPTKLRYSSSQQTARGRPVSTRARLLGCSATDAIPCHAPIRSYASPTSTSNLQPSTFNLQLTSPACDPFRR